MSPAGDIALSETLKGEMFRFTLIRTEGALAPRLGRLSLKGRRDILTPNFIGNTSRGVVPHVSQDNFSQHLGLSGVYVALEDFVEKLPQRTPPLFALNGLEPLRSFIALPQDQLLVLGARRNPPISSPVANTDAAVGLLTSVGFRTLDVAQYTAAARRIKPDIVVSIPDIPFGQSAVGVKRKEKMGDRTDAWLRNLVSEQPGTIIFASLLPIERDLQNWYLDRLIEDLYESIGGLAIYDVYLLDDLPDALHQFPRLSFHTPASPQELLRHVSLGIDIFTVPFLNDATDAGIALDFTFPAPSRDASFSKRVPLGIDMWHDSHALSVVPLSEDCKCYACTKHHRAYIQHLLSAKEMLGWVLLQIHNHAVLAAFFEGTRSCIANDTFHSDVAAFEAYYEPILPAKTGQRPRIRGYQFKSDEHAKKERKNPKAYRSFTDEERASLKSAHGQQSNRKSQKQDIIDDEALLGLVGILDSNTIADPTQLEKLSVEDAKDV